ncbi:NrsF family protein [Dyella sp.]|uniref:NrsF family protein n=1 Tax=Dyella sp. TaxID=1869338 RepID=UPI002D798D11|nr:NrsF family protein [Dyella sp.]HET6433702.1 NrsF family protein [Dyella sp.]
MADAPSHDPLIHALGAQLAPVRRLRPPSQRALGWTVLLAALAALLARHYGLAPMLTRWSGAPDLAWAGVGSALTAVVAAWVAFSLGIPGRSARRAWLVLPPALLWIGASGMGCLREWVAPDTEVATLAQTHGCFAFILIFSVPLSAVMVWLLRRAYPLRPVLAAVMTGLASAAASASLLEICHEFDAAATDLGMHALAVTLVIGINAACGGRLLQRR